MTEHEPPDASAAHAPPAPPGTEIANSDDAFVAFYRGTVKHLVGFLLLQGARVADAADIAQDTLCAAYQRWDTLDNPRAWSFRVASRALVRKIASVVEEPTGELPEPSPLLRTTNIDRWEVQHDIGAALARLPPRQRQVMAWTLYGYTPTEIAEHLDMNAGAVRASLKKARRALTTHLTGEEAIQ